MTNILMEVKHITKKFGSTVALNDVSFSLNQGEILGLIGENGSGKSTVTSIISGMQRADLGEMLYKSKIWNPETMLESLKDGVGMIVQESGTVPGITVAENIFLGETNSFRIVKGKINFPIINKKNLYQEAERILNQIGITYINPHAVTSSLDFQDRKLIEIAKVMNKNPEVLIVDETTTALSQKGRQIIYRIMKQMKAEGKSVIFISHDLDEIMEVCDKLTVLRDGKIIVTFGREEFKEELIKTSMIGRELQGNYYRSDYDNADSEDKFVLEIKDGNLDNQLIQFNMKMQKGEIVGVGGLSHCGMHTLGKVLFGAEKLESGRVLVNGMELKNEADAMKWKLGYVAKDRDTESLCLNASIKDNISVAGLASFSLKNIFVLPWKERKYVKRQIEDLRIKCADMNQYVSALSGGNKQKVVFGKWIGRGSEILILDCPTRGVDIGVKQAMYQLMYEMKKEGKTILLISEEMSELIGMSDRLLVMKDGEIKKEFVRTPQLCEADIIQYMI